MIGNQSTPSRAIFLIISTFLILGLAAIGPYDIWNVAKRHNLSKRDFIVIIQCSIVLSYGQTFFNSRTICSIVIQDFIVCKLLAVNTEIVNIDITIGRIKYHIRRVVSIVINQAAFIVCKTGKNTIDVSVNQRFILLFICALNNKSDMNTFIFCEICAKTIGLSFLVIRQLHVFFWCTIVS